MGMIDLKCGDMLVELDKLEENSVDSIVTDPPYELNFMGKEFILKAKKLLKSKMQYKNLKNI